MTNVAPPDAQSLVESAGSRSRERAIQCPLVPEEEHSLGVSRSCAVEEEATAEWKSGCVVVVPAPVALVALRCGR